MRRRSKGPFGLAAATTAALVLIATAVGFGLGGHSASANDIAPLGTMYNTDFASAGYGGIRGAGTGTLTLAGVSGNVTQALVYWHGPTNSTDPTANASITFAGSAVTGENIGLSDENCWEEFTNSQAYRADVTSLVTGDGSFSLAGLAGPSVDINGVSLLVFFDDGDITNNRDVVIFDGNDSNVPGNGYDADGWNVTLGGINYTAGAASMDLHVGDGQVWDDDDVVLNGATLVAGPAVFQGDTVPNGPSAGTTNGGLWDIRSFDVTSALSPGDNTLSLTTGYADDCMSLVVAAVDLPAGSAPDQPEDLSAPQSLSAVPETPEAVIVPDTGTGASSRGSSPWLVVALTAAGFAGAGGYVVLRLARHNS